MIGPRAAALLWALLDKPSITLNFVECVKSPDWTPPADIITCTASVTVSELPKDTYWIDFVLGHSLGQVSFTPKQLTTFHTWNSTGTSADGTACAWFEAVYTERIECNVTVTFLTMPTEVWLWFDMADGSKSQQTQPTNKLTMTYTMVFVAFTTSGTVSATVMFPKGPLGAGPFPIGDFTISPPPPPPSLPPSPPPSPPPPIPFALSNAMCEQQEPKLYECQVQVTIGSLMALITVTYNVGQRWTAAARFTYSNHCIPTPSIFFPISFTCTGESAHSNPVAFSVPFPINPGPLPSPGNPLTISNSLSKHRNSPDSHPQPVRHTPAKPHPQPVRHSLAEPYPQPVRHSLAEPHPQPVWHTPAKPHPQPVWHSLNHVEETPEVPLPRSSFLYQTLHR
ncbi:hypothetical protein ACKKBF_B11250 [Auxenochlorella protothecoides x Auxenochlorella symbiontica]